MVARSSSGAACMWVLKSSDFLRLVNMPSHEELRRMGLLVQWQTGFFCIFVSHQWLGLNHPDPRGEQLPVLQEALRNLLAGSKLSVDAVSELFGHMISIKAEDLRLQESYVWMDWFSIPQDKLQPAQFSAVDDGHEPLGSSEDESAPSMQHTTSQQCYISKIPVFVELCNMFVVLVPHVRHTDTGATCNYGSWLSRAWCRLELWCKMLAQNASIPVVVVTAPDQLEFAVPSHWIDRPPHEGEFTFEADRDRISFIMKKLLKRKLQSLEDSDNLNTLRYFVARYNTLLGKPCPQRTLSSFLADFRFESLKCAKTVHGMSPMACAVLSGDAALISVLCDAGCDVDRPIETLHDLAVNTTGTPLVLAVSQGWRHEPVLTALLEHGADANAVNDWSYPVLGYCKTARSVELLVQHQADVNKQTAPAFIPPLSLACFNCAAPEVIAMLLKHGAHANPVRRGTAGIYPLANLAVYASVNPKSLTVADLLLDAKADVNMQYDSSHGIFRVLELVSRIRVMFGSTSPLAHLMAEWTTTPLGYASFFGNDEMVDFLLKARADPEIPNARGRTPIQLARSQRVLSVFSQEPR
ncbi:unnamed protein product [Effrenium voratum]|nr:unnamed protein product [Effrenium voratum]|mmetsp:Transcript_55613/g.133048  ORF Transcript_55613/g.133048 Transcript_55613/m.133048 type:complete len:582 (+) Transcript_55613:70-1815(+)